MAGARKRASPALTAVKPSSRARWFRWAVLILLIAATPFFWLIARDALLILRADEGHGKEIARNIVANRLVETIRFSKAAPFSREPLYLTIVLDPSCFVIDGTSFAPSKTPAEPGSFRDKKFPSLEEILSNHRWIAEREVQDLVFRTQISDSFSTSELIALNGCIAATPLARWCENKVSVRIDKMGDMTYRKVAARLGLKAQQAGEPDRECYMLPEVVEGSAER